MFSRMPVLERSKITVWEGHLFKRYFFYGSFRYLSSFCRKVFSGAPVKCFPLYRSKYWDFVAFNSPLSERSKLTVWEQRLFKKKKKNWYGSFRYVSILRKKVFSGARVQCFSHCGSNNSDSAVFGNADFGEIKYHSLRTTSFQKKLSMEVFGLCLTYVERYFQEDQWIVFLFMAQVTQILLFLGMLLLERSKITDF